MKVWISPYELSPVKISEDVKYSNKGILLKFENDKYSLYHPIKELGDPSIDNFIEGIAKRDVLFEKVKNAAVSLVDFAPYESSVVATYYSSPSFEFLFDNAQSIKSMGFKSIKLKVSSLLEIKKNMSSFLEQPFEYIFDFNGRESLQNLSEASEQMKSFLQDRALYLEDPCIEAVSVSFVKVAADFCDYKGVEDLKVIKPTGFAHTIDAFKSENIVVTSYLDHPFGQLISALWAAKNNVQNDCGLFSHTYYEKNEYSRLFKEKAGLELSVAKDFFKLLEKEEWSAPLKGV